MTSPIAIRHSEFGSPQSVLRVDALVPEPMRPGHVRVRLLAATINPSDIGRIEGSYGRLPKLPAVAGREGVGEIVEVAPDAKGWKKGDRVRFPEDCGVWQTEAVAPADGLFRVPADIAPEQATCAFINPPTALLILKTVTPLQPGDWIIQNASNSAVGIATIVIAKAMGYRTLNVVRREGLEAPLRALGADCVVTEESGYEKNVAELTQGGKVSLALNSVGGASAIRQIRALADGGVQVTFGGMTGEPVRYPTRNLIFNDIHLRGFWFDKWVRSHSHAEVQALYDEIFALMALGALVLPVAGRYPLQRIHEALVHNAEPRLGKIILTPE